MKLVLHNLVLRPHERETVLVDLCARRLHAPVKYFKILKKSLDARDKGNIRFVYSVECADEEVREPEPVFPKIKKPMPRVIVVGSGPAGMFCALRLLEYGIRPVVLERGKPVAEREKDVARMCAEGVLDPESNVQFGEGGAGTFSDGKLNTQTHSLLNAEVVRLFLRFGAPAEIGYLGKPHIGSDKLKEVVVRMREHLIAMGGEIRFGSKLDDLEFRDGKLCAVKINGVREEADDVVLAIGHSARDTFEMLLSRGLFIEQKEFAVGVRIEHLQSEIGRAQYGVGYAALPPADYKLVSHAGERAAFTFCMCPGGTVVPSASEEGGVVVNGMSNFARDGRNANSALVVQVKREDFGSGHPLAGVEYQRRMERAAFRSTGSYRAPVQLVGDFLADRESYYFGEIKPTYAPSTEFVPMRAVLPPPVAEGLKAAIPDIGARLAGFAAYEAVLTGVESRTSSPVRILRGEDMQANFTGVYPCGEGCGYSGGIMSSAADGLRVADALSRKYL